MSLGAQAFMNKPLDIERLLTLMSAIKEKSA
jgi:hypothetical protein